MTRYAATETEVASPYLFFFIERYAEAFRAEIDAFVDCVETGHAAGGRVRGRAARADPRGGRLSLARRGAAGAGRRDRLSGRQPERSPAPGARATRGRSRRRAGRSRRRALRSGLRRHRFARSPAAARRAVSATRAARVSGRLACAIHSRMPRRAERGNAAKFAAAGARLRARPRGRAGSSNASTASRKAQAPSAFAASTGGAARRRHPARGLEPGDAGLVGRGPGAAGPARRNQQHRARGVELARQAVDPAEGEQFLDHGVVGDMRRLLGPSCGSRARPSPAGRGSPPATRAVRRASGSRGGAGPRPRASQREQQEHRRGQRAVEAHRDAGEGAGLLGDLEGAGRADAVGGDADREAARGVVGDAASRSSAA